MASIEKNGFRPKLKHLGFVVLALVMLTAGLFLLQRIRSYHRVERLSNMSWDLHAMELDIVIKDYYINRLSLPSTAELAQYIDVNGPNNLRIRDALVKDKFRVKIIEGQYNVYDFGYDNKDDQMCLFHLKSIPGFQFKSIPLLFRKQYLKKKGVPLSSSGLLAL
jgi:hypothetical protein